MARANVSGFPERGGKGYSALCAAPLRLPKCTDAGVANGGGRPSFANGTLAGKVNHEPIYFRYRLRTFHKLAMGPSLPCLA